MVALSGATISGICIVLGMFIAWLVAGPRSGRATI